jgi:hypothetical protein
MDLTDYPEPTPLVPEPSQPHNRRSLEAWSPKRSTAVGHGTYAGEQLASGTRLVSAAIDYSPFILAVLWDSQSMAFLALIFAVGNSVIYQGMTGHSLGKKLLGMKLGRPMKPHLQAADYELILAYPGVIRCAFRFAINLFFCITPVGIVIMIVLMLLGYYHRSLGDRFVKTIVIKDGRDFELEEPRGISTF